MKKLACSCCDHRGEEFEYEHYRLVGTLDPCTFRGEVLMSGAGAVVVSRDVAQCNCPLVLGRRTQPALERKGGATN